MKYLISLLVGLALPVWAQTPAPQSEEDWERARVQAEEMRAQAKRMRNDAEKVHTEAQRTCWEKFLVSSCHDEAKKTFNKTKREAKQLDIEAGRIERSIKTHERELKAQRRIDEAPQREAEIAKRAEEIRRQDAEALQRMEKKRADKKLNN
jgi:hypothetical protein